MDIIISLNTFKFIIVFLLKKICSQNILLKKQNESIMVTTRFFTFFSRLICRKSKMDIYKCPKSSCDQQVWKYLLFCNSRNYIFLSIYTVFAIFLIIFDSFSGIVPPKPPIACLVKLR